MSVDRFAAVTQERMDTLANLANTKNISGKPYAFSSAADLSTRHWFEELRRLRENVLVAARDGQTFIRREGLISGPWVVQDNLGRTGSSATLATAQRFAEIEYYYPSSGSGSNESLLSTLTINGTPAIDFERPNSNTPSGDRRQEQGWTFIFENDGGVATISGSMAGAARSTGQDTNPEPEFEFFGSLIALQTELTYRAYNGFDKFFLLKFQGTLPAGEFSIGVRLKNFLATKIQFDNPVALASYDRTGGVTVTQTTTARSVAANAIHDTSTVYKIRSPYSPSDGRFRIRFKVPIAATASLPEFSTVSSLTVRPSDAILSSGMFLAKTAPISNLTVNPYGRPNPYSSIPILNAPIYNGAFRLPTASGPETSTPIINKVTPAIEYLTPCYTVVPKTTPQPAGELAYLARGTMFFAGYVCKRPILDGQRYYSPTTGTATVTFGYFMTSGTHKVLEGVSIGEGSRETVFSPRWLIFTPIPVTYESTAPVEPPQLNIAVPTFRFSEWPFQDNIGAPVLSEHYNETEVLLNAIS